MTSKITAFHPPTRFVDEQTSGSFAWFRHEHRFEAVPRGTRLIDHWEHAAPLGVIGRIADWLVLGPLLGRLPARRQKSAALSEPTSAKRGGSPDTARPFDLRWL
jgi:ligand-binding SRPBCC domain-containing protein